MNEKEKKSENTGVWKIYSSMKTEQIGTHTGVFVHHLKESTDFKKRKRKDIELLLALFNVYLFGCHGNFHLGQYF